MSWCSACYRVDAQDRIERFLCKRSTCTCRCMHMQTFPSTQPAHYSGIPEGHVQPRFATISDDDTGGVE